MNLLEIIILLILCAIIVVLIVLLCICSKNNKDLKSLYEYQIYHDPLTGHTNWEYLWYKLGHKTDENTLNYDFVHFDIKDFRMFNELYDHSVGDIVLRYVSKTLNEQDYILYSARCHNDNFAFVTKPYVDIDLRETLEKLFESMKYVPGFEERPVYFRCGAVKRNGKLRSTDTVADMAKMAQKLGQKINCTEIFIYDEHMREMVLKGETLKESLPDAFMHDDILVYYQPKIDSVSEKIVGAEALARWLYHGKELLTPNKFIPYLEANNSIDLLDEYILERVCRDINRWSRTGLTPYPISVNLSKNELLKDGLIENVVRVVDKYEVERSLIEFEITETASLDDADYFIDVIRRLRNEGFSISIDDFGTGYSSFKILKDLPVNTLKIDKSFVDSVSKDNVNMKGMMILEDIVNMTRHLSLKCVAEGVEDEYQKDVLKGWGCDQIQGYFYSKPLEVNEFENKYLV